MVDSNTTLPLVSIFCFCKNSISTIKRSVLSVLTQSYSNIEYIFKEGGSTDGTLEYLYYIKNKYPDKKIIIIEGNEKSIQDAFFIALKQCTGDIIGSCLSDEELMPYAVEWAVSNFKLNKNIDAIYGDTYITNQKGNILKIKNGSQEFNIIKYLKFKMHMEFVSTFFKKSALTDIGLYTRKWLDNVSEYELITRFALTKKIKYIPGVVSKYSYHKNALSQNKQKVIMFGDGMINFINILIKENQIDCNKNELISAVYLRISNILYELNDYKQSILYLKKASYCNPNCHDYIKTKKRMIHEIPFSNIYNYFEYKIIFIFFVNFIINIYQKSSNFIFQILRQNIFFGKIIKKYFF